MDRLDFIQKANTRRQSLVGSDDFTKGELQTVWIQNLMQSSTNELADTHPNVPS